MHFFHSSKAAFAGCAASVVLAAALTASASLAYASDYASTTSIVESNMAVEVSAYDPAGEDISICDMLDQLCDDVASAQEDVIAADAASEKAVAQEASAQKAQRLAKAEAEEKLATVQSTAKDLIGTPYLYGGTSPKKGFDCSGFTQYVFAQVGIKLTHNAQAQYNETTAVKGKLEAGDLVFFGGGKSSITHVGIYLGNGKYIHSPQTGEFVRIDKLKDRDNYVGATRPLSD